MYGTVSRLHVILIPMLGEVNSVLTSILLYQWVTSSLILTVVSYSVYELIVGIGQTDGQTDGRV